MRRFVLWGTLLFILFFFFIFRPTSQDLAQCFEEENQRLISSNTHTTSKKPSKEQICLDNFVSLAKTEGCIDHVKQKRGKYIVPLILTVTQSMIEPGSRMQATKFRHNEMCSSFGQTVLH
jgi:hypothetical protein